LQAQAVAAVGMVMPRQRVLQAVAVVVCSALELLELIPQAAQVKVLLVQAEAFILVVLVELAAAPLLHYQQAQVAQVAQAVQAVAVVVLALTVQILP
jgi:ABC-type uncharacterized transport system permease subunit